MTDQFGLSKIMEHDKRRGNETAGERQQYKMPISYLPSDVEEMQEIGQDANVGRSETLMQDCVGSLQCLPESRHGRVEAPNELVEAGSDGSF